MLTSELGLRSHLPVSQNINGQYLVGRYTYFGPNTELTTWASTELISIGSFCSIADGVLISCGGGHVATDVSTWPFDSTWRGLHNPTRGYRTTRPTRIGHDVWIGSRAIVLGGARVGNGAIVAAGAVVRGRVPPYAVVVGNPARVQWYRFEPVIVKRLLRLKWWEWPDEVLRTRHDWFYRPVAEFLAEFEEWPETTEAYATCAE